MLVFILRIVRSTVNPIKFAKALVVLVLVKLDPIEVRLINMVSLTVVVTLSRVIESTKIVELDSLEKKVVLVIVKAFTDGNISKANANKKNI